MSSIGPGGLAAAGFIGSVVGSSRQAATGEASAEHAAARQSAAQSQQDRSVAGIAGTENSPERDADGRRLGGGASGDSSEDNPEDDSQPAAKSGLLRRDPHRPPDALGETGQRLDVTV